MTCPFPFPLALLVLMGMPPLLAAVIPSVAFCFWSAPLFRGLAISRNRAAIAWSVVATLSAGWFGLGWATGVQFQGFPLTAALISLLCAAVVGGMAILLPRTDPFAYSLAMNFLLCAWVFTYAFPWIGELA